MQPSRMVLYFAIYSFFGWVVESVFCSILARKPVNRGFLTGPFCPIYAAGSLGLLFVMQVFPKNIIAVFFAGLLLTSAVEYITGSLLELCFKTKWWDYSDHKFNIRGRVCLANSLLFGLMCVLLVYVVHPAVASLVGRLSRTAALTAAIVFSAYLMADLTFTVCAVLDLNRRLKRIQTMLATAKEHLDRFEFHPTAGIRQRIAEFFESADRENPVYKMLEGMSERIRRIELDNRLLQSRLLNAFPDIRSIRYPEILNGIKEQLGIFRKKN